MHESNPVQSWVHSSPRFSTYRISCLYHYLHSCTCIVDGASISPILFPIVRLAPSQSPNNMKAAATSSTKIAVNWQPIDTNLVHGVLLGYNVSYGRHVGGDVVWSYRLVSEETLSLSLEPLHKFVFYSVYVCGYTSKGCGEKTHIVTLRTFEDGKNTIRRGK